MSLQQIAIPHRPQMFALAVLAVGVIVVVATPRIAGPLSMALAGSAPAPALAPVLQDSPMYTVARPRSAEIYVTGDLVGTASPAEIQRVAVLAHERGARGCASGGVYVSGDLAGNASPAEIYAALCAN